MKHSIYSGPEQEKEPKFVAAKVFIFTKAAKNKKNLDICLHLFEATLTWKWKNDLSEISEHFLGGQLDLETLALLALRLLASAKLTRITDLDPIL